MTEPGLVIVGGGPAGLAAARAFRDHGGAGPVVIFTQDEHPPYNRPPLSKDLLRGESEAHELPLEEPSFYRDNDIELRLETRVVDLDLGDRSVVLGDGARVAYNTCVLAMGSEPTPLPVPGGDHPDLFHLRSRTHGVSLRNAAVRHRRAVVIGSGFIGCEAAMSLVSCGLDVTVVSTEDLPQIDRLGPEVADRIAGWLTAAGVRLVAGATVSAVEDGRGVRLNDGTLHSADFVVVAAGATPQVALAQQAGLAVEERRILVDAHMRTSVPGVLAAGDVACAHNEAAGRRVPVEHWGDALRRGEVAGTVAAGSEDVWAQSPGFWSEIGPHTLKYAAWGDGHDEVRFVEHDSGGFTAWYGAKGTVVGVLTHEADRDYERGQAMVEVGEGMA